VTTGTKTGSEIEPRVQYLADTRASQFTVQAFAAGMIAVVAHSPKIAIRDWSAEVQFVPDSLKDASLRVRAKTASFDVLDELRDDDRRKLQRVMTDEVLEVGRFPEFMFESSSISAEMEKQDIYRVNVTGNLTLHGITNSHTFFAQVAFGVDTFRAHGGFTLLQTDYGIKVASIAGGTLKLQDELKCSFYVLARKQV
jgi:polyisoprenoid-binding protein YceI